MLHSEQTCAHFCSEWSIVGYGTSAFWDLRKWSIQIPFLVIVSKPNFTHATTVELSCRVEYEWEQNKLFTEFEIRWKSACKMGPWNQNSHQTSNISHTLLGNRIVHHSDVVGASPVANYIFILDLTYGFIGLGKGNCKTRWETFKFGDLVCRILEVSVHVKSKHNTKCISHGMYSNVTHWCDTFVFYLCCIGRFVWHVIIQHGFSKINMANFHRLWRKLVSSCGRLSRPRL